MAEIVFGRHAVYHALKAGRRPVHRIYLDSQISDDLIVTQANQRKVPVETNKNFFGRFGGASHQGVVAEVGPFPYVSIEELFSEERLLLCGEIQDPQNLGSLCRSALLFGFNGIVLLRSGAVAITPAVCKVASGAVEYLKVAAVSSLPKVIPILKEQGYWIYGADASGSKDLYDEVFPAKVAFVLGGEDAGLSRLVRERCDLILKIPMDRGEIGSFNTSVAGAILMAEIHRQKLGKTRA